MAYTTNLKGASGSFSQAMSDGFGIVTVMNAYVCDALSTDTLKDLNPYQIANANYEVGEAVPNAGDNDEDAKVLCRLETLKVANVTMEGPTKTVTGGQFSNPLIKFGKSARLEMQDALGNGMAIAALCGGIAESEEFSAGPEIKALHFGEDFVGPKMIIGDSFIIDRKSGQQVPVKIVFYQFLPDSIFNLTQDAEGDATVFDMNGDLLTTVVTISDEYGDPIQHGLFYSIVDPRATTPDYASSGHEQADEEA